MSSTPPERPDDAGTPHGGPVGWGVPDGPAHRGAHDRPPYGPRPGPYHPGPHNFPPPLPAPGGVPLAPLGLEGYISGIASTVRSSPGVVLGLPAAYLLVAALLTGAGQVGILTNLGALGPAASLGTVALIVGILLALAGQAVTSATTAVATSRAVLGQKITVAQAWAVVRPRLAPVLGLAALALLALLALGLGIAGLVLAVVLALGGPATGAPESIGPSGVLTVLGSLLLVLIAFALVVIPLSMYLGARLSSVMPAVVLENDPRTGRARGPLSALSRSWGLTRGHGWRLAAIFFVVHLPAGLINGTLSWTTSGVPPTEAFAAVTAVLVAALTVIGGVVSAALLVPAWTLGYLDMRMRKERFDVDLRRAAGAER